MSDSIIAKIQALRAKTLSAGATEAEAQSAAEKAAALMEQYEISESQLNKADRSPVKMTKGKQRSHQQNSHTPKSSFCAMAIAELTRTKAIQARDSYQQFYVEFMGDRPDVELATYLFAVIDRAIESEFTAWRNQQNGNYGYGAKPSFQMAMVRRINQRIHAIIAERSTRQTGQWLVVVDEKLALVKRAFEAEYPRLRTVKSVTRTRHASAYHAGTAAGERVSFDRPLSGGNQRQLN